MDDAEWAARARHLADQGEQVDSVARSLLVAGAGPWATIKALRSVLDIGLREAKRIVDRNLPPQDRASNELLPGDGKPRFTPPEKVRYATRSDGVPVVLVEVEPDLVMRSELPGIIVGSVDSRQPLADWGIRINLTVGVLHGSTSGFLLAGPCYPDRRDLLDEAVRWIENLELHGGAISVLVHTLPSSDFIDGSSGRGGFLANIPRT